ncbi:hypothetical protein CONCODRAFT_5745 [Conidiobolus coronatus NRRL 28638]|uniref:C3H1-type domain-containing protein n=1 Tax=Conidiobolus coronatus (strain ATCC 28846 / CBS 209.66 / NRRL 28638) TaxID=796925 RepID=A0A137P9A4_CONC2|nr:hypothetical protein CONCODRAFT_5745 [Conidiobolus coronatus NRRL 28638]|eukprot:KXN71585.1 hypothetical protein CONCODRAFT_5745 [Conidiobolus coronatus NRRL 28638]
MTSTTKSNNSTSTICNYFLTPEGCRFGAKCQFVHLDTAVHNAIAQQNALRNLLAQSLSGSVSQKSNLKTVPCKFYLKGICRFGSECRYLHDIGLDDNSDTQSITSSNEDLSDLSMTSAASSNRHSRTSELDLWLEHEEDILNEVFQSNLAFSESGDEDNVNTSQASPSPSISTFSPDFWRKSSQFVDETQCTFFLENRCKFGDKCRNAHGHSVNTAEPNPPQSLLAAISPLAKPFAPITSSPKATDFNSPPPSPKFFFQYKTTSWAGILDDIQQL